MANSKKEISIDDLSALLCKQESIRDQLLEMGLNFIARDADIVAICIRAFIDTYVEIETYNQEYKNDTL